MVVVVVVVVQLRSSHCKRSERDAATSRRTRVVATWFIVSSQTTFSSVLYSVRIIATAGQSRDVLLARAEM